MWGGQVNDSMQSVNRTLEIMAKILLDAHDSFSSQAFASVCFRGAKLV
jgi:hypothetical protein